MYLRTPSDTGFQYYLVYIRAAPFRVAGVRLRPDQDYQIPPNAIVSRLIPISWWIPSIFHRPLLYWGILPRYFSS